MTGSSDASKEGVQLTLKEMQLLIADMSSRTNMAIERVKGSRDEFSNCVLGMLLAIETILDTAGRACERFGHSDGRGVPPRL